MKKKKRWGHPDFYKLSEEENKLHSDKNREYAEPKETLGNFNRVAHLCDYYNIFYAPISSRCKVNIIYMLKQFDCWLNAIGKGKNLKIEGFKPRIQDINTYNKIWLILFKEDKEEKLPVYGEMGGVRKAYGYEPMTPLKDIKKK